MRERRPITEKDLTKKFREFLLSKNALDLYLRNFNAVIHPVYSPSLKELRSNDYFFILRAFIWEDTPEGDTFWDGLNLAWQKIYNK